MIWKCKYCVFCCEKRAQLFKHYRLKHGSYARTEPFPCLHQECLCTFKSLNALKVHLTRIHTKTPDQQPADGPVKFSCQSCEFAESCSESEFFTHLHSVHLKVNHKVRCPYKDCNFESSVYSTFKAHKSKVHKEQKWKKMMKKKPNGSLVKKEMDMTFALRRKEVVQGNPAISQMVYYEFSRVVGKNLRENFFDALDRFSPNLMDLFRNKRGFTGQLLAELLHHTKTTEPTDIQCLCLRGLPVILGDDPSAFFRTCSDASDQDSYIQTPVGLLCIDEESPQLNPSKVGIVLEGSLVMDDLASLPRAFCILFGLIYALHLDYPKYMKNTFSFVQQVMLSLGKSQLAPKIQSLKNQLTV